MVYGSGLPGPGGVCHFSVRDGARPECFAPAHTDNAPGLLGILNLPKNLPIIGKAELFAWRTKVPPIDLIHAETH